MIVYLQWPDLLLFISVFRRRPHFKICVCRDFYFYIVPHFKICLCSDLNLYFVQWPDLLWFVFVFMRRRPHFEIWVTSNWFVRTLCALLPIFCDNPFTQCDTNTVQLQFQTYFTFTHNTNTIKWDANPLSNTVFASLLTFHLFFTQFKSHLCHRAANKVGRQKVSFYFLFKLGVKQLSVISLPH